jgi:hypothetical protein
MRTVTPYAAAVAFLALAACTPAIGAQEPRRSLDIGVNNTGLSIGDSRVWRGVRLNFRDSRLERVTGLNVTIWSPREGGTGDVRGLALGVPFTSGRNLTGIAVAGFGAGVASELRGIGIGGAGVGAGLGGASEAS